MGAIANPEIKTKLKYAAIRVGLEGFHLVERIGMASTARGRGLILTLHHVRPSSPKPFDPNAILEITPEFLDQALSTLIADGYRPVPLEDLPQTIASSTDDARFFAVTLDDGYRDNRDQALPVFAKHGTPFTVFVTSGFVRRTHTIWWKTAERLLNAVQHFQFDFGERSERVVCATNGERWRAFERLNAAVRSSRESDVIAQLDAVARNAGIDAMQIVRDETMDAEELRQFARHELVTLGAHTSSHRSTAHLDETVLRREFRESADTVEAIAGSRPRALAYPYGDVSACGPREFAAARAEGFDVAVTTRPGVLTVRDVEENPTALGRVSLNGHYQRPRYVRALASGLAFRFT